jgi:hypothetical protein
MAPRVHSYHAEASVLSAELVRPLEAVVRPQAYVNLPDHGGYLSERAEDFRLEGVISFRSAYTQVAGNRSEKEGHGWVTLATAVVEELNVLDVVTVDRVVAQISVEHPLKGYVPRVTFLGTRFEGLKIAGVPITPVIDLDFCAAYPGINTLYLEDSNFRAKVEKHRSTLGSDADVRKPYSGTMPDSKKLHGEWEAFVKEGKPKPNASVTTSLVNSVEIREEFEGQFPGKSYGNVLVVSDFGKIFFAELEVDCEIFRLSMIRLQMGCVASGSGNASRVIVNGSTVP